MRGFVLAAAFAVIAWAACASPALAAPSWSATASPSEVGFENMHLAPTPPNGAPLVDHLVQSVVRPRNARLPCRLSAGLKGDVSPAALAAASTETPMPARPMTSRQAAVRAIRLDRAQPTVEPVFENFTNLLEPAQWHEAVMASSPSAAEPPPSVEPLLHPLQAGSMQPAAVPLPGAVLAGVPTLAIAWFARRRLRGR